MLKVLFMFIFLYPAHEVTHRETAIQKSALGMVVSSFFKNFSENIFVDIDDSHSDKGMRGSNFVSCALVETNHGTCPLSALGTYRISSLKVNFNWICTSLMTVVQYFNDDRDAKFKRRGLSKIFDLHPAGENIISSILPFILEGDLRAPKICSNLFSTDVLCVSRHILGSYESVPNENHTKQSENRHKDSNDQHPFGPIGHLLLGVQILLGPLLFAGVPYCIGNAIKLGRNIEDQSASFGYFLAAVILVGIGTAALMAFLPNLETLIPSDHPRN